MLGSQDRHLRRAVLALAIVFVALIVLPATSHAQCISITSYGGSGNGTTNNSPALSAAFAALPSQGGCISFPGGRYLFSSAVTLSFPSSGLYSLTLAGAGSDATVLYWSASNGIIINANGARQTAHVRNLTFSTGTAGSYSGLTLNNSSPLGAIALSDILSTTFRGDDGGNQTDYWDNGIAIAGQSNVNFDSDNFLGPSAANVGNGILLNGNSSASPYYGIVFNIAKCGFFWTGNGVAIGNYIQGVTVTQSNFTNGLTGINLLPSSGGSFDELAITGGNQFAATGNQVVTSQYCMHLIVNGNLFFVTRGNSGIFLNSTGNYDTIINNVFQGNPAPGYAGIYVAASNPTTVVSGNVFEGLNMGIDLVGTSGWNVLGNTWSTVSTQVSNVGTNSVGVITN